jgi:exosortase
MAISNSSSGGAAELPVEAVQPAETAQPKTESKGFDPIELLQKIVASPAFVPGAIAFIGLVVLFWDMMKFLPRLWMSDDGYYSHGVLVPFISAYIVARAWPNIKDRPIKPNYLAIIPLLGVLFLARVAAATEMYVIASATLVICILSSIWLVAGFRWVQALFFPTAYLLFALPIWTSAINLYTNPLQLLSTKVAYSILNVTGFQPYAPDPTTILLGRFTLNVAVPCSGLKLLLALTAFTAFFMLVSNLKWWGNLIMLSIVVPLGLFINGLRIALIGIVGHTVSEEAGLAFHDYSGYVTLLICFFILFKIARGLGWKN